MVEIRLAIIVFLSALCYNWENGAINKSKSFGRNKHLLLRIDVFLLFRQNLPAACKGNVPLTPSNECQNVFIKDVSQARKTQTVNLIKLAFWLKLCD